MVHQLLLLLLLGPGLHSKMQQQDQQHLAP
jgi:hypothetical protein